MQTTNGLPRRICTLAPSPASLSFGTHSVGSTTKIEVEITNVCLFKAKFTGRTQAGEAFEPFAAEAFTGTLKFVYKGGELKLPESGIGK